MLFGGSVPHESCCDRCTCLSQHFFQIGKAGEQKSRLKIKNSCWMEYGKTFWKTFVTDVYSKKIPGFASQETKHKTFDSFSRFRHVFVFYTSCLVQSILKKKIDCLLKFQNEYQKKNKIFVLLRPSYPIKRESAWPCFKKLKLIQIPECLSFPVIPNALKKIWFSHSGWCFHGVALKQSDLLQSYLSKWLKDSQRVSSKSDGMLREFWEQFPDICLTFSQKKKKKKKKKKKNRKCLKDSLICLWIPQT